MELKAKITAKGAFFDGKGPEIVQKNLDAGMAEAVAFLEGLVKKIIVDQKRIGVHGAQGGFLSSVSGDVVGKGTPLLKGIVGSASPYGEVLEKGRRAQKAMPPAGSLLQWMTLKMGVDAETAKRIEFVVRRKIGRKGFPGIPVFDMALNQGIDTLQRIFDKYGFNIARELEQ